METFRFARRAIAILSVLGAIPCLAQGDEALPTLKLDRVPSQPAFIGQTRAPAAAVSTYAVETIVSGLSAPWALAFLPDGRMLVSENTGNLKLVSTDGRTPAPINGLPEISHEGWAGLFDVAIDPAFSSNGYVYFSYVAASDDPEPKNISRVARGVLDTASLRLTSVEVIVDGFGGQELHFAPDGTLLVSGSGDGSAGDAQDLATTVGKLLRVNSDGSVPADNPFVAKPNVRPEIFSYGHRDISGIATRPGTGEIWITEHGPRGGDELNRIRAGANYGWKIISYGTEYSGDPIGAGDTLMPGMEQPVYFWRPSIAPSGLIFYDGHMFANWRGDIFITSLAGQHLVRLVLEQDSVIAEERMLVDRDQRIREVRQGPDGALYVLTNEEPDARKGAAELIRIFNPQSDCGQSRSGKPCNTSR